MELAHRMDWKDSTPFGVSVFFYARMQRYRDVG